jgi:O-antigen ligase
LSASATYWPLARPIPAQVFGDIAIFLGVVSSCVVMFEPAPYDVVLGFTALGAFLMGLRIPRAIAPLFVLLFFFEAGGLSTMVNPLVLEDKTRWFAVTSLFLAFTCIFFACAVAERPERIRIILKAYTAAALLSAMIGIYGYVAHVEELTRFGRAKGAFKDPNVFGPFLSLPSLIITRDLIVKPFRKTWFLLPPLLLMLAGALFSFSRAAWFLMAFGIVVLWIVVFLNERDALKKIRLIIIAIAGLTLLMLALAIVLSIPEIGNMFTERAKLVQSYDGARLGRLARHWIGFEWVSYMPFGIGPLEFGVIFGEDPHNVYLKSFLGYGWLGGVSYWVLVLWTLAKLGPMMFRDRPWQDVAQVVFASLLGHTIIGWIIDSDHWRHFFMLWGIAWGMVALEWQWKRDRRRELTTSLSK